MKKVGKAGGDIDDLAVETNPLRAIVVSPPHVFYVAGSVIKQRYFFSTAFPITPQLAMPTHLALEGGYLYFNTVGSGSDGGVHHRP